MNNPSSNHRPWSKPAQPWVMVQTWRELLFAHWEVPAEILRPLLPAGLTLDTYEGKAWVGVVPFRITGIRFRGLIPIPFGSAFPELNVRTYVTVDDKPGVWFFSLDAANIPAVEVARATFHLPYLHANMSVQLAGDEVSYYCRRRDWRAKPGVFIGKYRPTGAVFNAQPGTLEDWLTARYCLYAADKRGNLYRAEIDHPAWSLQPAEAQLSVNTVAQSHGIVLPDTTPLLHYSHQLDVFVWGVNRI